MQLESVFFKTPLLWTIFFTFIQHVCLILEAVPIAQTSLSFQLVSKSFMDFSCDPLAAFKVL